MADAAFYGIVLLIDNIEYIYSSYPRGVIFVHMNTNIVHGGNL
jgi:hypothetical protein